MLFWGKSNSQMAKRHPAHPRNRVSSEISPTHTKLSQKPGFSPPRSSQKPGFFRDFSYSHQIVAETRFLPTPLIPETGFLPRFLVLTPNCRRNPVSPHPAHPRNRVSSEISRTHTKLSQKPGFSPPNDTTSSQKPGFSLNFYDSTNILRRNPVSPHPATQFGPIGEPFDVSFFPKKIESPETTKKVKKKKE